MRSLLPMLLSLLLSAGCATSATVQHPNLLLNREEIELVKEKIAKYPWAAAALEETKKHALGGREYGTFPYDTYWELCFLDQALYYAFTGDRDFADRARGHLLGSARSMTPGLETVDLAAQPEYGAWGNWGAVAWAYDLIYDTCSEDERAEIERWLRLVAQVIIEGDKRHTTTPNLIFGKHANLGLIGYCLGDQEIIDWALSDPGSFGPHKGGFYAVLDSMVNDGHFWAEAPIYALVYDVNLMLALAEASRHCGGPDLYHYVSPKSGASIKSVIDGYLLMGYPLERTGIGPGMLRFATFGDGGTSFDPSGTSGKDPETLTGSYFLTALEIAYARYRDPAYAWVLSLAAERAVPGWLGRAPWGYAALSHGEPLSENPTPPPAPSGVYPQQGFAMLRADETPAYWTSGALAAMVRLGTAIGHGHQDYYALVLHGKGRLLYPDVNVIQYEPRELGWTHEGIAHSTLLVDRQSPRPGPFTTRHDFNPDVKFFAVTGTAYPGVTQTRRLLLTRDYLADVFHAADKAKTPHTFDWVVHGLGRLYPGNPSAFEPSEALRPEYRWIEEERSRTTDNTWQADWIQRTGGLIEGRQFGPEWFNTEVGVRLTMLGAQDTQVYCGDGPITHAPPFGRLEGQPEPAVPLVLARRTGTSVTFAALHEPYQGSPKLRHFRRVAESEDGLVMAVERPDCTDYLCIGLDDQRHTLAAADGEVFVFDDYGYLRLAQGQPVLRGGLRAFRIRADRFRGDRLLVNDRLVTLRRAGAFCDYGRLPEPLPAPALSPGGENPQEHAAALHYWFLPEEVHLSALKESDSRQTVLHLRCVGPGTVSGRLRITAPAGLRVEPSVVEIPRLAEGREQTVPLIVTKSGPLKKGLYPPQVSPDGGLRAVTAALLISVGVVITPDRRHPEQPQYVVRAPGYTTQVDEHSGVSFYLLDADGRRRFGRFYGNFAFGFPGIEGVLQYRTPCKSVLAGEGEMTIVTEQAQLHYAFDEERIIYSVVPPSDPDRVWKIWLGTFDILENPLRKSREGEGTNGGAETYFLPHPVFRQGMLITLPPGTELTYPKGYGYAVSFPLQTGKQVVIQFLSRQEWEASG